MKQFLHDLAWVIINQAKDEVALVQHRTSLFEKVFKETVS